MEVRSETTSNCDDLRDDASSHSISNGEEGSIDCIVSNVNAAELDEETTVKLKGDAIGDTLYSESFVLKTLLQFSNLEWSKQVEEDLCFLWDMTMEKDVCDYLFKMSFPSLVCSAITKYKENRFREIVIGILANIICADCEKNITEDEIDVVLLELDNDDHLILIQVVRFISAVAHHFKKLPFISEEIVRKITFILNNSMNCDLLVHTLEATAKLTTDYKMSKELVNLELFQASVTAYRTVINEDDSIINLDSKEKQQICRYMLEVVSNICSYIDTFECQELLVEIQRNASTYVKEIVKILDYYSHEENLFPVSDEFVFYMAVIRYTLTTLNVSYMSSLFLTISKIFCYALSVEEEVPELFDAVLELECFLLSKETPDNIKKDLMLLSKDKVKVILNTVKHSLHKYDFETNIQELLCKCK